MIDIDPEFATADGGGGGAETILHCGIECNRDIKIFRRARWLGQQFGPRQKIIFRQHSLFIPGPDIFAEFFQRQCQGQRAPQCVSIRANVTQDREFIVLAQGTANFSKPGVALVHALPSRAESISCMISMTRVPRSIESSRWKTRWGVYFKTTCFAKADCKAARCASS